jgi:hypothetical protein
MDLMTPDEIIKDIVYDICLPTIAAYFPAYEHVVVKRHFKIIDPGAPNYFKIYKLPRSTNGMPWIDVANYYLVENKIQSMGQSGYSGSINRQTMLNSLRTSLPLGDAGIMTSVMFEGPDLIRIHPQKPYHNDIIVKMQKIPKLTEIKPLRALMFVALAIAETKIHIHSNFKHLIDNDSAIAGMPISGQQIADCENGYQERQEIIEQLIIAKSRNIDFIEEIFTATGNL